MKTLKDVAELIFKEGKQKGLKLKSVEVEDEDPSYPLIRLNTSDSWFDEFDNEDEEAEKSAINKLKQILSEIDLKQIKDEYEERLIDYRVSDIQYDGSFTGYEEYDIYLEEK